MDAHDPVEHAVTSMPPFMQRRMAKLSLAGARFVLDPQGINAWKVYIGGEVFDRYTHLAVAINEVWCEWMSTKGSRAANTEIAEEQLFLHGSSD